MTEAEVEDVWDQAGENALNYLTTAGEETDPDFDLDESEQFPTVSNVNGPEKVFRDKHEFSASGTLNVLSPATIRKTDKSFVKTINAPLSAKVINSIDHMNLQNQNMNKNMYIPDKSSGINNISRESSVTNDLNSLCGKSLVNDMNITANETGAVTGVESSQNITSEWDGLERQILADGQAIPSSPDSAMLLSTPLFSYQDALQHFKSIDLSIYESDIMTSIHLTGIAKFFAQLCGPPRLKSQLKAEKTFVFCLARCQFDNDDPKDFQLLMTIYKSLTGTQLDCARFGSHWQDIGFQGNDPATDLRGTGMLSLLTILYLVREQKSLAQKLYQLSQNETQNFPFCVLLINLTKIALVALRSGYLNKECNKRLAILPIMCDVFSALTYEHYKLWKTGKTIRDSGFVLKRLEEKTKSSSQCTELISNYKKYCNEKDGVFEKGDIVFLNVCKKDGQKTLDNYGSTSQKKGKLVSKYATR